MTHILDALGRIKEYWGELALGDLADYARGRIIRGGAADWEAYSTETLGAVLIGDGTDIVSDTTPTFVGLTTHNAGIVDGTLGAGVVQSTAGGGLLSSALAADQLDMGIGDMIFNRADGLLLLNPDGEINATEWWSLRKQKATLSGAFHQEVGRWLSTRGLVIEEATTNLILNPSLEVDTTGYTADATTLTSDATYSVFGDDALKVVTDNVGATEGFYDTVTAETAAATEYTYSVYLRGSGIVYLFFWDTVATYQYSVAITLASVWTRYELTVTFGVGAVRRVGVMTQAQQNITFYCDGFQLEQQDYATSYCDGTLGTGYAWTGAAHGSTSERAVTEVNLDAHAGLISSDATLSFRFVVQMPYDADGTWPQNSSYLFDTRAGADDAKRIIVMYSQVTDDFQVYINGGWRLATSVQTFDAGGWVDIIITVDFTEDEYYIYVNGLEEDFDETALIPPTGLNQFNLGSNIVAANQGGYNIVEFAAFNRVLTAAEVAGMFALQRPLVDAGALPL